jgi:alkanesulfonate monooxygenase SsuD/methylene tetrahydromethanopterin reductase-like flavin-dependent oxidoreductase (luciferase family)
MPPPGTRLARLGEAVQVVTALLAGDTVDFEGAHYAVRGAQLLPPPVQRPRPPVFAGGKGDRLLRLVARHADGWNTCWTWTVEAYRERRDALTRACDAEGRDPASVRRSLGLYTLTGEDEADLARRFERLATLTPPGVLAGHDLDTWRKGRLVGPVQDLRQMVDEWAALGVDEIICGLGAVPFQVSTLDDLELVAHALR